MRILHGIDPVFDCSSTVLVLGSFPSVRSREEGFFYGNPQNRFWKVLAGILKCPVPDTVDRKKRMLLDHGIALWDVIASCEISGSSDASIRNAVPNDLSGIFAAARIRAVAVNGSKAEQLYRRYLYPGVRIPPIALPSTSPANASWSLGRLQEAWSAILPYVAEQAASDAGKAIPD